MVKDIAINLRIDSEDTKVMDLSFRIHLFSLLDAAIYSKRTSNQEISCRLALGKVLMKGLKNIELSLSLKIWIMQAMILPVILYGIKRWTLKKFEDRKSTLLEKSPENTMDSQENEQMDHRTNHPEFSLKANMSSFNVSYLEILCKLFRTLHEKSLVHRWKGRREKDMQQQGIWT